MAPFFPGAPAGRQKLTPVPPFQGSKPLRSHCRGFRPGLESSAAPRLSQARSRAFALAHGCRTRGAGEEVLFCAPMEGAVEESA